LVVNSSLPSKQSYLEQNIEGERAGLARCFLTLPQQIQKLSGAYSAFTEGKFSESKKAFLLILQCLPLIVVPSPNEAQEIEQIISICREYLIGLTLEAARKELMPNKADEVKNQVRIAELAACFTHCDLNEKHLQLTLKVAINCVAKIKNFGTLEELGSRLLAMNPPRTLQDHAEKALKMAKTKGSIDATKFNYDPRNPFVLCCSSLSPIYQGSPKLLCPFCGACYQPAYQGKLCQICQLAEVGKKGTGLVSVTKVQRK